MSEFVMEQRLLEEGYNTFLIAINLAKFPAEEKSTK